MTSIREFGNQVKQARQKQTDEIMEPIIKQQKEFLEEMNRRDNRSKSVEYQRLRRRMNDIESEMSETNRLLQTLVNNKRFLDEQLNVDLPREITRRVMNQFKIREDLVSKDFGELKDAVSKSVEEHKENVAEMRRDVTARVVDNTWQMSRLSNKVQTTVEERKMMTEILPQVKDELGSRKETFDVFVKESCDRMEAVAVKIDGNGKALDKLVKDSNVKYLKLESISKAVGENKTILEKTKKVVDQFVVDSQASFNKFDSIVDKTEDNQKGIDDMKKGMEKISQDSITPYKSIQTIATTTKQTKNILERLTADSSHRHVEIGRVVTTIKGTKAVLDKLVKDSETKHTDIDSKITTIQQTVSETSEQMSHSQMTVLEAIDTAKVEVIDSMSPVLEAIKAEFINSVESLKIYTWNLAWLSSTAIHQQMTKGFSDLITGKGPVLQEIRACFKEEIDIAVKELPKDLTLMDIQTALNSGFETLKTSLPKQGPELEAIQTTFKTEIDTLLKGFPKGMALPDIQTALNTGFETIKASFPNQGPELEDIKTGMREELGTFKDFMPKQGPTLEDIKSGIRIELDTFKKSIPKQGLELDAIKTGLKEELETFKQSLPKEGPGIEAIQEVVKEGYDTAIKAIPKALGLEDITTGVKAEFETAAKEVIDTAMKAIPKAIKLEDITARVKAEFETAVNAIPKQGSEVEAFREVLKEQIDTAIKAIPKGPGLDEITNGVKVEFETAVNSLPKQGVDVDTIHEFVKETVDTTVKAIPKALKLDEITAGVKAEFETAINTLPKRPSSDEILQAIKDTIDTKLKKLPNIEQTVYHVNDKVSGNVDGIIFEHKTATNAMIIFHSNQILERLDGVREIIEEVLQEESDAESIIDTSTTKKSRYKLPQPDDYSSAEEDLDGTYTDHEFRCNELELGPRKSKFVASSRLQNQKAQQKPSHPNPTRIPGSGFTTPSKPIVEHPLKNSSAANIQMTGGVPTEGDVGSDLGNSGQPIVQDQGNDLNRSGNREQERMLDDLILPPPPPPPPGPDNVEEPVIEPRGVKRGRVEAVVPREIDIGYAFKKGTTRRKAPITLPGNLSDRMKNLILLQDKNPKCRHRQNNIEANVNFGICWLSQYKKFPIENWAKDGMCQNCCEAKENGEDVACFVFTTSRAINVYD